MLWIYTSKIFMFNVFPCNVDFRLADSYQNSKFALWEKERKE